MRHPTEEKLRRDMRELIKRARQDFGFGTIVAVKHRMSLTDLQQLYTPDGRQLRILAAGNGADTADIGKFWFVVGYSEVGGPDIVPAS
jgi:hypothetical protein